MRNCSRSSWIVVLLVLVASLAARAAPAADYPARPVTIVTQAPTGTGPDVIARLVADRLGRAWGREVLVVGKPGAGGLIAAQAAAAAKPDGYTLYLPLSSTFIVLPESRPSLPVDLGRDFAPIGLVGEQPMVIAANPGLGVTTLHELVARAKARPGEILYGSNPGNLPNAAGEMLAERAGIKLGFVAYGNVAKATQDAVAGTLQLAIESLSGLAPAIRAGQLVPLAVAARVRLPEFPELPTVAEALPGLGVFEARGWLALMAPAGTPDAVIRKVSADLRAALAQPDLAAKFAALGTYAHPTSPSELAAFIRAEQTAWRPFVRQVVVVAH